jgi:hypothetical protein
MARVPMSLLVLLAVGSIGAIGYSELMRGDRTAASTQSAASQSASTEVAIALPRAETPSEQIVPPSPDQPVATTTAPSNTLAKWVMDASSNDAGTRAAAITALAQAPRLEAIPVLQRVLTDGEPTVDRPLALESLRTLALNQGDSDNLIRGALRNTVYDGNDEAISQSAIDVLAEIENGLTRTVPHPAGR